MTKEEYDQIVKRMVEAAGHTTQSFGMGRVLGQIFAQLYFIVENFFKWIGFHLIFNTGFFIAFKIVLHEGFRQVYKHF